MDIVSKLPLEISRYIFSYLNADDLGRCLRVSKQFRRIANDDFLWKHHCMKYGLSDVEECETDSKSDLCHWSLIWNSFGKTPGYKWHSNSYRRIELIKNEYAGFALHENTIACFCKTFNNLDVYTVKKNTNRARLLTSLAVCIPNIGDALVAMNSNYIAFLKYNILLVFTRNENTYELTDAYAVVLRNVVHANQNFPLFVKEHLNQGASVEVDAFCNNIIWLSDFEGSFVIDINTNHMAYVFTYDCIRLHGDTIVTWSDGSVLLYSIEGILKAIFENIDDLEDVCANKTMLSLLRGDTNDICIVEVYDWESDEQIQILRKEMPIYTWIKMHPNEEILYTLEASSDQNVFRIAAWFIRSDTQQWVFETNNSYFVSYWELHVVCEKYLVMWPTASDKKTFYFFDSKTGKCLYEESTPSGVVHVVSNTLWIAWPNDNSLDIRSYE